MSNVILLDFDDHHRIGLTRELELRNHTVVQVSSSSAFLRALDRHYAKVDYIILDFTRDREEDWQRVDYLERMLANSSKHPAILGFSRVYRGAMMRLRASKKGIGFLYED